jgi:hypothetical protein
MHNQPNHALPVWMCLMLGCSLLSIGLVLMLAPEVGEVAFGSRVSEDGNYSFHRATGIREAYLGVLMLLLVQLGERRALGTLLLTVAIIPLADFLIVLNAPDGSIQQAFRHGVFAPIVMLLGWYYFKGLRQRFVI